MSKVWPPRGYLRASFDYPGREARFAVAIDDDSERPIWSWTALWIAAMDHIILVQVGPDQDYFLDLFQRELAPALRARHPG